MARIYVAMAARIIVYIMEVQYKQNMTVMKMGS
jgi:hypothetical protein